MARICSTCKRKEGRSGRSELRPYGKGGALVCYDCGMKDLKTTTRVLNKKFDAIEKSGDVVAITDKGCHAALNRRSFGGQGEKLDTENARDATNVAGVQN